MKKIVIIGANGYIARNLIYVLKRDYASFELHLYGVEVQSIDHHKNYTTIDMTNKEDVKKIDLSCDIIFMLAGKTGTANGFDDYISFVNINEVALLNLLSEYKQQNSKARIVFPSTRLVYKGSNSLCTEDSYKEFKTIYAINKFACEQYLEQYHCIYGIQYTIFRICVPYGTLIPQATSYGTVDFMLGKAIKGENISLYGDGEMRRTLTFIEDICKTLIVGAISEECANDIFNVGGEDYSLREMAELISKKYNVSIEYTTWPERALKIESGNTVFDSSKLDAIIGCITKKRFIDWIKDE